jgi:sugar phosphate isomerase/epimerase
MYEDCRQLAAIGEENGVVFCMECHDWTLTETKESALALMEAVSSPHFRMYWQPNQWVSEEENLAFAEQLQPYAKHIHVFNWTETEKFPLSLAIEPWRNYLTRFTGERALLLEFMPKGTLEELIAEAEALRQIAEV